MLFDRIDPKNIVFDPDGLQRDLFEKNRGHFLHPRAGGTESGLRPVRSQNWNT